MSYIPNVSTFLVFYRFKTMTNEEARKAKDEWNQIRNNLPSTIELVGEYSHAWGTKYNGFLLFEADNAESFLDWWTTFKSTIRWYVMETHTIVARRK